MITKEERLKMSLSESRFERKRGLVQNIRMIITLDPTDPLKGEGGKRFRYFIFRRKFWKSQGLSHDNYFLARGLYEI